MISTGDGVCLIPIRRADLFNHGDCDGVHEEDEPQAEPLGIGTLDVILIGDGFVTISAGPPPGSFGPLYIELDLAPDAARQLGRELLGAADAVDPDRWRRFAGLQREV